MENIFFLRSALKLSMKSTDSVKQCRFFFSRTVFSSLDYGISTNCHLI